MSSIGEIFLPLPIITVTLNPALDKTININNFHTGVINRSAIIKIEAGGKGINVASVLHSLGMPVIATGLIAGRDGRLIINILKTRGVATDFQEVPGETRLNLKIIDPVSRAETEINENGFTVSQNDLELFQTRLKQILPGSSMLILSGSLPPGVPSSIYASLIEIGSQLGVPAILDAEGDALREGMMARPLLIKPNQYEAELLLGEKLASPEQMADLGKRILDNGPEYAVVSFGPRGAVAIGPGMAVWAVPPQVDGGSTVGAGDAMVAVLAMDIQQGRSVRESLPRAVAAGTLLAMRQHRSCKQSEIEELAAKIAVVELPVS
jgi:1-phosphofructokinase